MQYLLGISGREKEEITHMRGNISSDLLVGALRWLFRKISNSIRRRKHDGNTENVKHAIRSRRDTRLSPAASEDLSHRLEI